MHAKTGVDEGMCCALCEVLCGCGWGVRHDVLLERQSWYSTLKKLPFMEPTRGVGKLRLQSPLPLPETETASAVAEPASGQINARNLRLQTPLHRSIRF